MLAIIINHVFYQSLFRFYVSIRKRSWFQVLFNKLSLTYVFMYGFSILIHLDTANNFKVPQLWLDNVSKLCSVESAISIDPETANFEKTFLSLPVFAMILGPKLEVSLLGTQKYAFYNETSLVTTVMRMALFGVCMLPCLAPLVFIKKTQSYWFVIVFRTIFPPFSSTLYQLMLHRYCSIKCGLANT